MIVIPTILDQESTLISWTLIIFLAGNSITDAVTCPAHPIKSYTKISGNGTSEGTTITYTCDDGAISVSGNDSSTSTCNAQGAWSTVNINCTKCSSYANTYTNRTDRFFNPPVSFVPSISGGSVTASYCANSCNTRSDFVCVAYYYRKSTGGYCVLRPMRVHDDASYPQYDNDDTDYDEYIRDCVLLCPDPPYIAFTSVLTTETTGSYTCDTGAVLSSGNDPATSTCTDGTWSSPNIHCTRKICADHLTIHKNKRMAGQTFRQIPVTGLLQCGKECVRSKNCESINFNRESLICELNWSNDLTLHISKQNWDYIDRSQFTTVLVDPCSNVQCPLRFTCVLLKSGKTTCALYECIKLVPSTPKMKVLIPCSSLGCDLTLSCDAGYAMFYPNGSISSTYTATCLPDGSWSPVTATCNVTGCASYTNSYTVRTNWNFHPPGGASVYGGDLPNCREKCNTHTKFICVAYYFNKVSNRCNLTPHRVYDNPDYQQYENPNTNFDEYIRDCAT